MNTAKSRVAAVLVCLFTTCLALPGVIFAQKKTVKADYHTWIAEYEKGNSAKAFDIGVAFYHGISGAPLSYQKAQEWFLKAAGKDNDSASVKLGDIYSYGQGVKANKPEAMKWYRAAAEKENVEGQEKLGDMYYNGDLGKRDYILAEKWYRKAAEKGLAPEPCSKLAQLYLLGEGVKEDYPEALKWFLKADDLGDIRAAAYIADIYRSEQGIKKDLGKAAEWLAKGAVNGDTIAMRKLAEAYAAGEGVNRSYTEAYKWLTVVTAKENNAPADQLLAQVTQKLNAAELASAKKQASELAAKYVTPKDKERKDYDKTLKGR